MQRSHLNLKSVPLSDEMQCVKLQTKIVEEKIKDLQAHYDNDFVNLQNMISEMNVMKQELHIGQHLLKMLDNKAVRGES